MLVEQELCRKLVDIFRSAMPPKVDVEGNWLPSEDGGFKGEPDVDGSVLKVRVSQRGYTSYTNKVAEFKVELEGTIRVEDDTDMSGTFVCCGKLLTILSGWQDDIAAVKRDLSVPPPSSAEGVGTTSAETSCRKAFDPVGYLLGTDGDLDIEDNTLTRKYNQSFTIKGRISK